MTINNHHQSIAQNSSEVPGNDQHKQFMKQMMNDISDESTTTWDSTINEKVLTRRPVNGQYSVTSTKRASRTFRSEVVVPHRTSTTFGSKRMVLLEVPMHYGRSGVPGLSMHQASRLAIHTSFPLFSRQQQHQATYHLADQRTAVTTTAIKATQQYWIPDDVTCQLSAATAIRAVTGSTSGSINLQYRWDHITVKNKLDKRLVDNNNSIPPATKKQHQQSIQRWSTTVNTGIGLSESDSGRGIDTRSANKIKRTMIENKKARSPPLGYASISNIVSQPTLRLGISTNISHHQTSSSSLSINVQQRIKSNSSLPVAHLPTISLSNQQQMKLPHITSKQSAITVRSRCVTAFDYNSSSTLPTTINLSISFSPEILSKSTMRLQNSSQSTSSEHIDRRVLQDWSVNIGWNKMKDSIYPSIGFSSLVAIPNILQSIWTIPSKTNGVRRNNSINKLFDFSLQWKGVQGWQLGGWWIQRKDPSATKSGPLSSPTRQIGVGITINKSLMNKKKSSNNSILTAGPFGILSWIFTWTEGDFTLRIPILVSSAESAKSILYHQGFQIFYLSFLSTVIQDVITHLFLPNVMNDKESDENKNDYIVARSQKFRQEAIMQQSFMERQAKTRTALELAKNGLVIQRAIMYIHQQTNENGISSIDVSVMDEKDKFDVTVPLQFWLSTNESKLVLFGKRSCMLGFYDLATTNSAIPSEKISSKGLNMDAKSASTVTVNRLWVQYAYEGQSYEITINDDEEVELPNIGRSNKSAE